MLKRVLVYAGITFIVFFVAFKPAAAGSAVKKLGETFVDILQGIGDFFSGIVA